MIFALSFQTMFLGWRSRSWWVQKRNRAFMQRKILRWFSQCFQIFHWRSIQNHWRWRWEITRIVISKDCIFYWQNQFWKISSLKNLWWSSTFFSSLFFLFTQVYNFLQRRPNFTITIRLISLIPMLHRIFCFQRPNAGEHSIFIFGAIKVMQQFLRDKDYYYTHFDTTSFSELSFRKQRQRERDA